MDEIPSLLKMYVCLSQVFTFVDSITVIMRRAEACRKAWHPFQITTDDRCRLDTNLNCRSYVLDGDNIRHGLNKELSFGPDDRRENIRSIAEVEKLFVDAEIRYGVHFTISCGFDIAQSIFHEGEFIGVNVKCPLSECERRVPKGLYKKANGEFFKSHFVT